MSSLFFGFKEGTDWERLEKELEALGLKHGHGHVNEAKGMLAKERIQKYISKGFSEKLSKLGIRSS